MFSTLRPGLVEPVLGNSAEHAAVRKTAGCVGRGADAAGDTRISNEVEQVAVVVRRLREVALPLERRRHPVALHVVAAGARRELMAVEEEHLVAAARLADRSANRIAEIALLQHRLRIAVQDGSSWLFEYQSELRSTS